MAQLQTRVHLDCKAACYDTAGKLLPESSQNQIAAITGIAQYLYGLNSLIALIDESKLSSRNSTDLTIILENVGNLGAALSEDIFQHLGKLNACLKASI